MEFAPGDRVHLPGLGTGVVREPRGARRYAVEIKGRVVIVASADMEPVHGDTKTRARPASAQAATDDPQRTRVTGVHHHETAGSDPRGRGTPPSIDLHGKTAAEAVEALEVFVNDALLDGWGEARVIHGRSGGRVKAAVHHYLRRLPSVSDFRLDPHNPGITIVRFA